MNEFISPRALQNIRVVIWYCWNPVCHGVEEVGECLVVPGAGGGGASYALSPSCAVVVVQPPDHLSSVIPGILYVVNS